MTKRSFHWLGVVSSFVGTAVAVPFLFSAESQPDASDSAEETSLLGISANPGAVNAATGNGDLAEWLGWDKDKTGVFLGGLWVGNGNVVVSGGEDPGAWSWNQLFVLNMCVDTEKMFHWKGGSFGITFLQFNGQHSNEQAGSAQQYQGLGGPEPENRTELSELWYRQELIDGKVVVRVGKMTPTIDFNNVLRPVPTQDDARKIPSVSGLIYTPIFKNPTLIGVMGSNYNTVCGVVATIMPTDTTYLSYGFYDGNIARGVQTGRNGPQFNGYYFNIWEAGVAWELGPQRLPGLFGLGLWYQTGILHGPGFSENGAIGTYFFASQRLWLRDPDKDNSGVSAYAQFGANNSEVLPFQQYFGTGLTAFGLMPHRENDSFGAGMAWSWLNSRRFGRPSELMFQAYYQAHIAGGTYLQPVVSYIPTPGLGADLAPAWTATMQVTVLF